MASVHAAMAYYFDNQETIDSTLAEDEAFVEAFKRSHPSRLQQWELFNFNDSTTK